MASRGEIRTTTLALKILELQRLHLATNQQPILLLDDVFSELDGSRRRALTAYLQRVDTLRHRTDHEPTFRPTLWCRRSPHEWRRRRSTQNASVPGVPTRDSGEPRSGATLAHAQPSS